MLKYGLAFVVLLSAGTLSAKKPIERNIISMGVRGRVTLQQLDDSRAVIQVRTKRGASGDTIRGDGFLPVLVNERKLPIYFGRFGASQLPMLIFGVSDPDRIQDSRVVAYQVTKEGGLIGQKVVPDRSLEHGHTTSVSGGRYDLIALDPELGTIHSVAYQEARFADYLVAFEKLRVRQWEPSIDGFLEVDEGFLRDKRGRLVETMKFRQMNEPFQQRLFLANVSKPAPRQTRVQPVARAVSAPATSVR